MDHISRDDCLRWFLNGCPVEHLGKPRYLRKIQPDIASLDGCILIQDIRDEEVHKSNKEIPDINIEMAITKDIKVIL